MTHHHYTCFGAVSCTTVNFIFMERSGYVWYVKLSNGETIEDIIETDIVNQNYADKSNAMTVLDEWYENNLASFENDLDDSVWCNDKSIASRGGWDKDGNLADKLTFNANYRSSVLGEPSLECSNPNDRFTVSDQNGNGRLSHPIGLITLDEGIMSGFSWMDDFEENETNYLYLESPWWTMSPSLQSANYMYQGVLYSIADNVTVVYVNGNSGGVRPAITLKSEKKISDGDGTKDNPFTILGTNG